MSKWQKFLLFSLSHLLVACVAVLLTFSFRVGYSSTDSMSKLEELNQLIQSHYIGELDETKMMDAAAAGMVAGTGDRWSYYISAKDMAEHQQQKKNVYVGIGVTISMREDGLGADILRVEPGGSAKEAGILPGDILQAVEGQPLSEIGLDGAGELIKGQEETQVKITVLRNEQQLEFTLTRKKIQVEVAQGQMLENDIGYIRIDNFNSQCAAQSIQWTSSLLEQGAKALIFDVRYNGGGYASEMVELLDYLLPEGDLFISEDYLGKVEVETSNAKCVHVPMVVLVNDNSYSAAEFFAAALREYDKAKIVGIPTTGKGYFQNTYTLSDGSAVALSVGKYFTPKGVSLAEVGGLTPDRIVEVDEQTAAAIYSQTLDLMEDPQVLAAISLLQEQQTDS